MSVKVLKYNQYSMQKKQLYVAFDGEPGVDDGGVRKEWFLLAVREVLRVEYGVFERNSETGRYWLRADAIETQGPDALELLGLLCGLALYNSVIVSARFPLPFWQKLLGERVRGLDALALVDPAVAQNLRTLLAYEGDVEDFDLNFVVTQNVFGQVRTHELVSLLSFFSFIF